MYIGPLKSHLFHATNRNPTIKSSSVALLLEYCEKIFKIKFKIILFSKYVYVILTLLINTYHYFLINTLEYTRAKQNPFSESFSKTQLKKKIHKTALLIHAHICIPAYSWYETMMWTNIQSTNRLQLSRIYILWLHHFLLRYSNEGIHIS